MLSLLLLILSIGGTVGTYLLFPSLSLWLLLPIFLAAYVGAVVLYFVYLILSAPFLPMKKPIKKPNRYCRFMIGTTMNWLMGILRIRVKLIRAEKLPQEPCVIVSNHRSDFDPMTMLAVLRHRKLAYISKKENFKIPLVGCYIYHAGFISIDRENSRRAVMALQTAADRMRETGVDIGIYPEGTRSKTGKLLRFKTGAYLLAQKAHAPIVVMTTKGTEHVFKGWPFRSAKVELEVLEVIDKERVQTMSLEELADHTRGLIEQKLYPATEGADGHAD